MEFDRLFDKYKERPQLKYNNKGHKAGWIIPEKLMTFENTQKITKLMKTGEDLTRDPRISVSTIHGVKGNERENVVVTTDLSNAAFIDYEKNQDDTHRLFYVACTRTENNLFIIEPQRKKAYDI